MRRGLLPAIEFEAVADILMCERCCRRDGQSRRGRIFNCGRSPGLLNNEPRLHHPMSRDWVLRLGDTRAWTIHVLAQCVKTSIRCMRIFWTKRR